MVMTAVRFRLFRTGTVEYIPPETSTGYAEAQSQIELNIYCILGGILVLLLYLGMRQNHFNYITAFEWFHQ